MTVIPAGDRTWRQGNRPDWMRTPSAGFYSLAAEGNVHDCHFHELNEIYFISRGKAKILNGGREYYVQESDIVCIKAGDEHDLLEVYGEEDLQLFYVYEIGAPDARLGHLHTTAEKSVLHEVARKPVPGDFPKHSPRALTSRCGS